MTGITDETAAAITGPGVSIRSLALPDPTDYLAILRELRRECGLIREQYLDAEFFVATASGTPQMHACWFLLTASGEVPAVLLQVRPPTYVTKDLPVVTETIPSASDFPRVLPNRLVSGEDDPLSLIDSALESVGLVVQHPAMRKLAESAAHVAPVATTVLVLGETGTGKEMFAQLIHTLSKRRGRCLLCNKLLRNLIAEQTTKARGRLGKFLGAERRDRFPLKEILEQPQQAGGGFKFVA